MARTNVKTRKPQPKTHEGAPAKRITLEQELQRSINACMLWEDAFYESGVSIADRIQQLATQCKPEFVAQLAVDVRHKMHLRHAPLWLLCALAKTGSGVQCLVANAINDTIARPDEMAELLALYKKLNGFTSPKFKIPNQFRKGIARVLKKFDAHQLDKWDRAGDVPLRAVLRKIHPKPSNPFEAQLWGKLRGAKDEETGKAQRLETADTLLSGLAAGKHKKSADDKKTVFEWQLREDKLGYQALLMNLRGMCEANVDRQLIIAALQARKGAHNILPFRYIAAARACPQLEPYIDEALCATINGGMELSGTTYVLVDVSGSMHDKLSKKSDMSRMDAAAALASIIKGDRRVFTFSSHTREVVARTGMAGVEAIIKSQPHGWTDLGGAVDHVNRIAQAQDRFICITDEQSSSCVGKPVCERAYMINVGAYQNGVGYGDAWVHIDGFSEHVLRYIMAYEEEDDANRRRD